MAPCGKELSLDFKELIISLHKNETTTLNLSKSTGAKVVQHYQKYGTIILVHRRSERPRKLVSQNKKKVLLSLLVNCLRCVVPAFQLQRYDKLGIEPTWSATSLEASFKAKT